MLIFVAGVICGACLCILFVFPFCSTHYTLNRFRSATWSVFQLISRIMVLGMGMPLERASVWVRCSTQQNIGLGQSQVTQRST